MYNKLPLQLRKSCFQSLTVNQAEAILRNPSLDNATTEPAAKPRAGEIYLYDHSQNVLKKGITNVTMMYTELYYCIL